MRKARRQLFLHGSARGRHPAVSDQPLSACSGGPLTMPAPVRHPNRRLTMETEVLIVGASPTGLLLANQLVRHGVRPLIIDPHSGPAQQSRAMAAQARTLEIFAKPGTADRALELGKGGTGATLWVEGERRARILGGYGGRRVDGAGGTERLSAEGRLPPSSPGAARISGGSSAFWRKPCGAGTISASARSFPTCGTRRGRGSLSRPANDSPPAGSCLP